MTPPAVWPRPVDPKLAALIDAVDAFLCAIASRDDLLRALKAARA